MPRQVEDTLIFKHLFYTQIREQNANTLWRCIPGVIKRPIIFFHFPVKKNKKKEKKPLYIRTM